MNLSREKILYDLRISLTSREVSRVSRQEVLKGKARFGAFSDGLEIPQIAMSSSMRKGDFLAGYYREQTTALHQKVLTPKNIFSQLYAHGDSKKDPSSSGRAMVNHISTPIGR